MKSLAPSSSLLKDPVLSSVTRCIRTGVCSLSTIPTLLVFLIFLLYHSSFQRLLVKMNSIPMGLDVPFIIQQANGSQQDTVVNATAGSIKFKSTTEGILLAYGSLVIMALIPVVVGSYKSIAYHQKQKKMSEVC